MGFEILSSIPRQLRGRGDQKCVPIKCECSEQFLWPHQAGRIVSCPNCRVLYTVEGAAFDQTHNGQQG
jgi:hypothetical protein